MPLAETWIQLGVAFIALASLITTVVIYRRSIRRQDYADWIKREEKHDKASRILSDEVKNLDKTVSRIGGEVRHNPTHRDMGQMHEKLNKLAREVSATNSTLVTVMQQTTMINQYLMENKGNG